MVPQTTGYHIPDDSNFNTQGHENLKYHHNYCPASLVLLQGCQVHQLSMGEAALLVRETTGSLQVVGTWQHVLLYWVGKHDAHLKQGYSLSTGSSQMKIYTLIISG
jgi:hypothetical protein